MNQYNELLKLLKEYIKIFNNWETTKENSFFEYQRLQRIYLDLIDILENAKVIEQYGIKKYKIIETGELI